MRRKAKLPGRHSQRYALEITRKEQETEEKAQEKEAEKEREGRPLLE